MKTRQSKLIRVIQALIFTTSKSITIQRIQGKLSVLRLDLRRIETRRCMSIPFRLMIRRLKFKKPIKIKR